MQSPPVPRYLVPPRSKYSPQHLVLKHPQFPFLSQCQRPNFTPIQNNRQNYSSIYAPLTVSYIIFVLKILIKINEHHIKTNGNGDVNHGIVDVLETNASESNCGKHETDRKVPNLCMSIFL